jgi:hypothetical protein
MGAEAGRKSRNPGIQESRNPGNPVPELVQVGGSQSGIQGCVWVLRQAGNPGNPVPELVQVGVPRRDPKLGFLRAEE